MPENILAKIIKNKNEKIESLKKTISLESLNELIKKNNLFFSIESFNESNEIFFFKLSILSFFLRIILARIFSGILDFF